MRKLLRRMQGPFDKAEAIRFYMCIAAGLACVLAYAALVITGN